MGRDREILHFWLGDLNNEELKKENMKKWFKKDPTFDKKIRTMFGTDMYKAAIGKYEHWVKRPRGALALIILFDQFTRNMFRGSGDMFQNDADALSLAKHLVYTNKDKKLHPTERMFVYMPFMHSESLEDQEHCIQLFEELDKETNGNFSNNVHYAKKHRDIVKQWGRFPHRNKLLLRKSTPEEIEFLKGPGSSF